MKNIFLVSSPLQLLCAIEAVYHFRLSDNHLIIVNRGTNENYSQLKAVYQLFNEVFDDIIALEGEDRTLTGWIKKFNHIDSVFKNTKLNNAFIGDYHDGLSRHVVNSFKLNDVLLLDDGWATLLIDKKLNNNIKLTSYRDVIKYIASNFKYSYGVKKNIKYFTFFDEKILPNSFHHNFENLTKKIELKYLDSTLYFLGSPVVEDGVFAKQRYIDIVKKYLKRSDEKNIYYLPHRREKKEKIELLIEDSETELLKTDIPIELYLLKNNIEPSKIASLYSTALYTLSKILKRSTIDYIKIDFDVLLSRKDQVKDIYSVLEEI